MHIHFSHFLSAPAHICECCYMLPFKTLDILSQRFVIHFLFYPWLHSTSIHFASPQILLISINHPWQIFATPLHFPACSIWPRHTAQCHTIPIGPLFKYPILTVALYNTSFSTHTAYFSCTILKTEAANSSETLIPIRKSTRLISQKTRIFITATVRTSNFIYLFLQYELYHLEHLNLLWRNT